MTSNQTVNSGKKTLSFEAMSLSKMNQTYYLPLIISLKSAFPIHDLIIRPLLENCKEAFIYGLSKESELYQKNSDILINDKKKFKLDLSKECIKGHEHLWNATGWERGSIVIILENNESLFKDIFKNCYEPGLCATPNSGNSLSAARKCKEEALKSNIAICFPASNGIEWMQIYATPQLTEKLLQEAVTKYQ